MWEQLSPPSPLHPGTWHRPFLLPEQATGLEGAGEAGSEAEPGHSHPGGFGQLLPSPAPSLLSCRPGGDDESTAMVWGWCFTHLEDFPSQDTVQFSQWLFGVQGGGRPLSSRVWHGGLVGHETWRCPRPLGTGSLESTFGWCDLGARGSGEC